MNLAVDIGCGPGYTTRLAAAALKPLRMVGIDSSEAFVTEARRLGGDSEQYMVHDATIAPFPVGPADILYARFVATHLRDPENVIRVWTSQLAEGGLLLLDEVESITTSNPVLSRYLDILSALFSHEGKALYVGPALSRIRLPGLLKNKLSYVRQIRVQNRHAAAMFRYNLEAWRDHPFIVDTYGARVVNLLEGDLELEACGSGTDSNIEWAMRQIVLERT